MKFLPLFHIATRLNSQKPYETEIQNEICLINFYMNIGTSKLNFWTIDPTRISILPLFQFQRRLLTLKHLKIFSTWNVARNGAMWKRVFDEHRWKTKTKYV